MVLTCQSVLNHAQRRRSSGPGSADVVMLCTNGVAEAPHIALSISTVHVGQMTRILAAMDGRVSPLNWLAASAVRSVLQERCSGLVEVEREK